MNRNRGRDWASTEDENLLLSGTFSACSILPISFDLFQCAVPTLFFPPITLYLYVAQCGFFLNLVLLSLNVIKPLGWMYVVHSSSCTCGRMKRGLWNNNVLSDN